MKTSEPTQLLFPDQPVLVVDDEINFHISVDLVLRSAGINHIVSCRESPRVKGLLAERGVAMVLLDLSMPELSGQEVLAMIGAEFPHIPVIVVTASNDVRTAVECIKGGAFDFLIKPVDPSHLVATVQNALQLSHVRNENRLLRKYLLGDRLEQPQAFSEIVSADRGMLAIFKYIEAIAGNPLPVLITGESGTGKELAARALHRLSGRQGEFVAVNISGFDDQLFSDSLFGHYRGAFTGADQERRGLIAKARGGTLFLDEIGELSLPSQVKLLRLLQEKQYYPLGADIPAYTDCRVIVATNRDLEPMIAGGQFRKDLYYRLQTHHVHLPPLRRRSGDIALLLDYFLETGARLLNKRKPRIPPELVPLLERYPFPGNIRELESMVLDALSRHSGGLLPMKVFQEKVGGAIGRREAAGETAAPAAPEAAPGRPVAFGEVLPTLGELEEIFFSEAVQRAGGNLSLAARLVGLKRMTFHSRWQQIRRRTE